MGKKILEILGASGVLAAVLARDARLVVVRDDPDHAGAERARPRADEQADPYTPAVLLLARSCPDQPEMKELADARQALSPVL